MKKSVLLKKLISITLALVIGNFTAPYSSYAVEETSYEPIIEYSFDSCEFEIPTSDLIDEDGFTGVFYYDDESDSIEVYTGDNFDELNAVAVGSFSVNLVFSITRNRFHLSWSIHYPQLTYFSANLYCKNTSILTPTYYVDTSEYQSFSGVYDQGYGESYTYFSIPSSVNSVRVGWTDCYIHSFTDIFSIQNGSSIVNPASVKP